MSKFKEYLEAVKNSLLTEIEVKDYIKSKDSNYEIGGDNEDRKKRYFVFYKSFQDEEGTYFVDIKIDPKKKKYAIGSSYQHDYEGYNDFDSKLNWKSFKNLSDIVIPKTLDEVGD